MIILGVLASHPRGRDVHIHQFSVTFHGQEILSDADFEMNCGRRYGLVGLNGSGKSTILACIGNREVSLTGVQQRHRGTSLRRLKIPFICDLVNVLTRQYTRVYHSIETAARMFTDPSVDASILDTLIKMTLEVELAKNEDWQLGVVRVKSVESMLIEGLFV